MERNADNPIRVLCVDDSSDITGVMQMMVDAEPDMECVGCLASANDLIAEVRGRDPAPDVVILDASMPGRDPLAALKELAAVCPATRAIVYSAHDDAAFTIRALDAGAWGCASKRDEPTAILRAVREVASGRLLLPRR